MCILSRILDDKETWRLPSNPWLREKVLNKRANTVSLNDLVDWTHDLYVWNSSSSIKRQERHLPQGQTPLQVFRKIDFELARAISKAGKRACKDKHDWAVCVLRSGVKRSPNSGWSCWISSSFISISQAIFLKQPRHPQRLLQRIDWHRFSQCALAPFFILGQITLSDFWWSSKPSKSKRLTSALGFTNSSGPFFDIQIKVKGWDLV